MLATLFYTVLFLIYVFFCLLTINVFVKKITQETHIYLYIFYLYYSILLSFIFSFVETDKIKLAVETIIYMCLCAIICLFYYKNSILVKTQKNKKELGSRI